jgi:mono/diheme cytochrome c family protein
MIGRKLQLILARLEPHFSPLAYKATLIGMLIAAFAVPLGLVSIPYLEIFNDMAVQSKGKAQGLYGQAAERALIVDRMPVPGTMPMDYHRYEFTGKEEAVVQQAEQNLENPLPPSLAVLKRGQKVFHDYCRTCHGVEGFGDGPIVGPSLFPAPPSLHTETARAFRDGRIYHIITRGQNVMPPYADKIDPRDRWAVIHFVRALQRAANPKPEDLEP